MTIHWKALEQYFNVVLFVFQFYPVCNFLEKFGKFITITVYNAALRTCSRTTLGCGQPFIKQNIYNIECCSHRLLKLVTMM